MANEYGQAKSEMAECALPIGTILTSKLRSYKVVSVLGAGGFGITYKVSAEVMVGNVPMLTYFALKEHFMKGCSRDGDGIKVLRASTIKKDYEQSLSDFVTEAHRLNKLGTRSPNIVKVNEVFSVNGTAYYVMEFLDGGDLLHFVHQNGSLSEGRALSIIMPIAKAVATIHKEHLLHLDIKPDNIVLKQDPNTGGIIPVLIDFGISKHFGNDGKPTTRPYAKGATDGYAPVEQYSSVTSFAPEMDVYALGATLYFMLTGKNPSKAFDIRSVTDLLDNIPSGVSDQTRHAVGAAMRNSRFDRTPDVDTFIKSMVKTHTLPVGYVLRSNKMKYLILDIVDENYYSITYKAIPTDSVSNSPSGTDVQGNPTATKITYWVHELFFKDTDSRKEGGMVVYETSRHAETRKIFLLQEEAAKSIPQGYLNEYDADGNVKAEKFSTNNTLYYTCQVIEKPLSVPVKTGKIMKILGLFVVSFVAFGIIKWYNSSNPSPDPAPISNDTIVDPLIRNSSVVDTVAVDSGIPVKFVFKEMQNEEKKPQKGQKESVTKKSTVPVLTLKSQYDKALSQKDWKTIRELADKDYSEAYAPLADYYLKSNKYELADKYAKKAKRAGVGLKVADKVIEILQRYGYYDVNN